MTATITVEGRQLSNKKRLFPDRFVPYPPHWQKSGGRTTLRDVISRIVSDEVANFRQRQHDRRLIQTLTAEEISTGMEIGKIDSGGRDLLQSVDEEPAIATALQAFEDGLYLVFIEGHQQTELDNTVYVIPDSKVTFIRLVLLVGG